jgi:hypothetical protein
MAISAEHPTFNIEHRTSNGGVSPHRAVTEEDLKTAVLRRSAVEAFRALQAAGKTNNEAAREVGYPKETLYRWDRVEAAGGLDALLPQSKQAGRKPGHKFSDTEAAAVRALVLQTNRNATAGSTPEALRVALKRGLLSPENAALIQSRFDTGKVCITPAMRNQVRVNVTTTQAARGPRNAWLKYVESPGSLNLEIDEATGLEREIEPGEKWTLDDATINFVCCVPFNLPGNRCSEKFGVMVGRFQFLVPADHRSHFIPGFNYTARPRSSYRAEDLTATLHTAFTEHGYPRAMILEHGVSAAKLVTETLNLLDIKIERAASPHQKVIEGIFNKLWTKLSMMPGQVGRFMGDEEESNKLVVSCRAGHTDPTKHFPMLADVLKALHESIREHNSQLIKSVQYGQWIPQDYFERLAPKHLRKLDPKMAWMFSPVVTDPLKVRGFKVRTTVKLMEDYSEVFDFSAEWMANFNGATVKLYFNPFAPDCLATVVLAQNFSGHHAGEILGVGEQINRMTRFRRRILGYGLDPDIGLDASRRNAQALRRSSVAIRTDGTAGAQSHEARSGVGAVERVSNFPQPVQPTAEPVQRMSDRLKQRAAGVSQEDFDRQAARLERQANRAAARKNLIVSTTDD